jgi:hypothetical protein
VKYGELTLSELRSFQELQENLTQTLVLIGNLELQKASAIADAAELQARLQHMGRQVTARLGIPDGVEWSVDNQGFVNGG